jgi:hypothetical protein
LIAVSGFTGLEALAIARASPVVGELEIAVGPVGSAGRFAGFGKVAIGAADFAFT